MLFWIIQTTIISVILIFLVHHLINFFKSTLTVPKFKDLVNAPTHKYENIFNIIKQNDHYAPLNNSYVNNDVYVNNNNNNNYNNSNYNNSNYKNNYNDTSSDINLLPKMDNDSNYMKNELKDFLKKQLTTDKIDNYKIIDSTNVSNYAVI